MDALIGIDEEVTVAEYARRKRRDRDERRIAVAHQRGVVRQRHLGGVEFAILQHAPEDFGGLQRQVIQVDAFGLQRTVTKGLGAVVRSAREGEAQLGHSGSESWIGSMKTNRIKRSKSNDRNQTLEIKPSDLILRRPRSSRGRLEGWPLARSRSWPSFETRASFDKRSGARSSGRG